MPSFVAVKLGTSCPECMGAMPVNRIAEYVFCAQCLSVADLRQVWREDLFAAAWVDSPTTWEVGKRDFSSNASLAIKLDVERVAAPPAGVSARAADEFIDGVFPGAVRVHGESPGGDPTEQPSALPMVFACLECGAGLRVDGTARVVTCQHCSASNFLPDALWLRMHPALKRQWLVVEWP